MNIERLSTAHNRTAFDCGEASLNQYLQRYARQNAARDIGVTYVAVSDEDLAIIAGYYTLSSSAIEAAAMPPDAKLPRYPVPMALVARLAVDRQWHGSGVGRLLLTDVLVRLVRIAEEMAIHAVEVHALHERAKDFYVHHGFTPLVDDPLHLFLPVASIRDGGILTKP